VRFDGRGLQAQFSINCQPEAAKRTVDRCLVPRRRAQLTHSTVSAQIQACLSRLSAGNEDARDELIELAFARLFILARKIKTDFPTVSRAGMETGDVLHDSYFRLDRSLREINPTTVREFYGLAALQIRRVLLDVCRHLKRQPKVVGVSDDDLRGRESCTPDKLADWTAFHEFVEKLEPKLKETFDLLFYQGLSQREAAEILGVDERTVKRRWRAAREQIEARFGTIAESS
jgi:RNA polymerase sigma factor (sigma-70 family)